MTVADKIKKPLINRIVLRFVNFARLACKTRLLLTCKTVNTDFKDDAFKEGFVEIL